MTLVISHYSKVVSIMVLGVFYNEMLCPSQSAGMIEVQL